jgi:hypothetical protein
MPAIGWRTTTSNPQIAVRPEPSVAVQVTGVLPTGNVDPEAGTQETDEPGQFSPTAGGAKVTIALVAPGAASVWMLSGQVIDGACVSLTVTLKLQLGPAAVVTVTRVVPFGKKEPDGGVSVTAPHVPPVVGAGRFTTAPHWSGSFDAVTFAGQVTLHGGSCTSMLNVHCAVLFDASVAVQVTCVVPTLKVDPDAGTHTTLAVLQASDAVGVV